MNTPDPKLIEKLTKLLALSKDGGATEHEASLAAEIAQRLMAEHNLSMASVEAAGGSTGEGGKREDSRFQNKTPYKWTRELMVEIGSLNFCHVSLIFEERYSGGRKLTSSFCGFRVIGRASNVAATQVMFDYLVGTINRLAAEAVDHDPSRLWTRYAASFREGCAHRLSERLESKRYQMVHEAERKKEEQRAAGGSANGLIVLTDVIQNEQDLNDDLRHGLEPGTTARRRAEQEAEYRASRDRQVMRATEGRALGLNDDEAYYYGLGYDLDRAKELASPGKPETEAQRRKRQEKEDRQQERWREQQRAKERREWAKRDARGYARGQDAGDSVGLDQQIGTGKHSGRIG